jgi:hypothetical protein
MFMSLLYVRTKLGVARASPSRRAAQSVLLGASAVGATLLAAVLWVVASVMLDIG